MDHKVTDINNLPSAIEGMKQLKERFSMKKPVIFLDYDGTLTPIVTDPAKAILSFEMRQTLILLSSLCYTIVVSGRDRKDVKNKVGLEDLYYAGSHGFDISGPGGLTMEHAEAMKLLSVFDEVDNLLNEHLKSFEKVQVERKRYAIAVHYRNAGEEDVEDIKNKVNQVLDIYPVLKKGPGKKIVELKPNIDWDKGRAVLWIMRELKVADNDHIPVYIGDDLTDEDAFSAIQKDGVGIVVGTHDGLSKASYRLGNVDEVMLWLQDLIVFLKENK